MGSEVHPVDGLDAEPCNAGGRVLDAWLSDRLAGVDDSSDKSGNRKIGNSIEHGVTRYARKLAPVTANIDSRER